MNKVVLVLMLSVICLPLSFAWGQEDGAQSKEEKTIVVMGSSVASGWVTSFESKYDMKNGYAYRLERLLKPRGYSVVNRSVPGDATADLLARFDKDLDGLDPDFIVIGLSLGNEGIEGDDPDAAFASFEEGMRRIIKKCRDRDAIPVVGLCYACNSYSEKHYRYTKKMNLLLNQWKVPGINFLGGVDDGHGHFPEEYTYDEGHPDNRGHEEMFLTIVPSLFDALVDRKPAPVRIKADGAVTLGGDKAACWISCVPDDIIHSFTMAFDVRVATPGVIASIGDDGDGHVVRIGKDGFLTYEPLSGATGEPESFLPARVGDDRWHNVVISHRHLAGETLVFVDGRQVCVRAEKVEPNRFLLGQCLKEAETPTASYRDLFIYRAALNMDEVGALLEGKLLQASLEVYAPLRGEKLVRNHVVNNLAQSTSKAFVSPDDSEASLVVIGKKLEEAKVARANEFIVTDEKVVLELDPVVKGKLFREYEGKYDLAPGVSFVVRVEEGRLLFEDPDGNAAPLLPESESKFFIKFPMAELTVTFHRNDKQKVEKLVFSANGNEMPATKQ